MAHASLHGSQQVPTDTGPTQPKVLLAYDERMTHHIASYCEKPDRIVRIMQELERQGLRKRCLEIRAREATEQEIATCHDPSLMAEIDGLSAKAAKATNKEDAVQRKGKNLLINKHTAHCARLAAGACVDVATAVARSHFSPESAL